jgi:hypothetical protein
MLKLSIVGGKELVGVSLPPEQNEYGHVAKRLGLRRAGANSLVNLMCRFSEASSPLIGIAPCHLFGLRGSR